MNRLNIQKQRDVSYEEIIDVINQSNLAKQIVHDLNMTKAEIMDFYDKVLIYASQNECCEHCKGLDYCKKTKKGHIYSLKRNEEQSIIETIGICNFYKDYDQQLSHLIYSSYEFEKMKKSFNSKEFLQLISQFPVCTRVYKALHKGAKTKGCYVTFKDSKQRKTFVYGLVTTLLNAYDCALIHVGMFLQDLKSLFSDKVGYEELLNKIYNAPILIIDDFGGESVTTWSRDEVLLPILNYRLDHELVTIFVSEFNIEQLSLLYTLKNDSLKVEKLMNKVKGLTQVE